MRYFIAVCDPEIRYDNNVGRMSEIGAYIWFRQHEHEWSVNKENLVGFSCFKQVQSGDRIFFYVKAPIKRVISLFKADSSPSLEQLEDPNWAHWVKISQIKTSIEEQGVEFRLLRKVFQNRITQGHSFFEILLEEYVEILELM